MKPIWPIMVAVAIGFAPAANATEINQTEINQTVEVSIKHLGKYAAAVCALDILEGRCDSVRTGQTKEFTVHPPKPGSPVEVRVIATKGGSEYKSYVTKDVELCFETGGTRKNPTIDLVSCSE